jgi:hypothetical protein
MSAGTAEHFLISALDGIEWSAPRPACFAPGERALSPVPSGREAKWAPEAVSKLWRE